MNKTSIKSEFTKFIKKIMNSENPRMNGWYCGITNNEERRKTEHKNLKGKIIHWKCIDEDSMRKANEVEAYFSLKGTKNLSSPNGAVKSSWWIYVFNLPSSNYGLGGIISNETIYKYAFGK